MTCLSPSWVPPLLLGGNFLIELPGWKGLLDAAAACQTVHMWAATQGTAPSLIHQARLQRQVAKVLSAAPPSGYQHPQWKHHDWTTYGTDSNHGRWSQHSNSSEPNSVTSEIQSIELDPTIYRCLCSLIWRYLVHNREMQLAGILSWTCWYTVVHCEKHELWLKACLGSQDRPAARLFLITSACNWEGACWERVFKQSTGYMHPQNM